MKKIILIVFAIIINMSIYSCSNDSDDEVFLEQMNLEEQATDGDGTIMPPPPPPDDYEGGN